MMSAIFSAMLHAAEAGRMPDAVIRVGIRRLLRERAVRLAELPADKAQAQLRAFITECCQSAVAVVPEKANEQHYEVPAQLFAEVLGPQLKYSCCYWDATTTDLAAAETAALQITCERAGIVDGMRILELGCGWGSLSLWMAKRFPKCQIVGVSNSAGQREFILHRAAAQGLHNLEIITADINTFEPPNAAFDRVVSVEMFEHMRNHQELLRRISTWLVPGGKLFVHIFCHRSQPYLFEDQGPQDWMTHYFFAGGMMPSDHLLLHFQRDLNLTDQWRWGGQHYQQTCNAWLALADEHRSRVLPLLAQAYGESQAYLWLQRWRMFFMACAELFGFRDGNEWWVAHYLFEKPQ